jgi:hypothetical protein
MKISQAMSVLSKLQEKHGDVEVETDCDHCGRSTTPNVVVAVALLKKDTQLKKDTP